MTEYKWNLQWEVDSGHIEWKFAELTKIPRSAPAEGVPGSDDRGDFPKFEITVGFSADPPCTPLPYS